MTLDICEDSCKYSIKRSATVQTPSGVLRLFVYGTLKQGSWNHRQYCQGVLSIEKAVAHGRLYEHPAGFPMLFVHKHHIRALGSTDPIHDVHLQDGLAARLPKKHTIASRKRSFTNTKRGNGSRRRDGVLVHGEILTFADSVERLSLLDRLEAFDPSGESLYLRVLIPVTILPDRYTSAWTYIGIKPKKDWPLIRNGLWPRDSAR